MNRVFFKTFGCRTNIYDTNVMISNIKDFIVVDSEKEADIIVINSCTVTNGADSNIRNYINKFTNKKIILAGCGAFSKGEELYKNNKVYGVFGHSEKEKINTLLKSTSKFFQIGDLNFVDKSIVENFKDKSKAFIKIQEGCNFTCSYCIIPFVRGKARSQNEETILTQIKNLALNGYGEFVLTGTNIGSYGKEKNTSLSKLLQKISLIKGVKRVRLGSLEPSQIDDEFKEILDEGFLERHLHIALQHTNEEMLKIMRRRNNIKNDLKLFNSLHEKGFALGTDFIVGHPGENEDRWQDGFKRFKEFHLTHLHAFTYSKRDLTHSASLKEDVRGNEAKKRLQLLEEVVKKNNLEFRKKCSSLLVLVEEKHNNYYIGYDQYFNRVFIKSLDNIGKEWIKVDNYRVTNEGNFTKI